MEILAAAGYIPGGVGWSRGGDQLAFRNSINNWLSRSLSSWRRLDCWIAWLASDLTDSQRRSNLWRRSCSSFLRRLASFFRAFRRFMVSQRTEPGMWRQLPLKYHLCSNRPPGVPCELGAGKPPARPAVRRIASAPTRNTFGSQMFCPATKRGDALQKWSEPGIREAGRPSMAASWDPNSQGAVNTVQEIYSSFEDRHRQTSIKEPIPSGSVMSTFSRLNHH